MDLDTFWNTYFPNLKLERLCELFDLMGLAGISNTKNTRQHIKWLSELLFGNSDAAIDEIRKLNRRQQFATFSTWMDITRDVDALRNVMKYALFHVL